MSHITNLHETNSCKLNKEYTTTSQGNVMQLGCWGGSNNCVASSWLAIFWRTKSHKRMGEGKEWRGENSNNLLRKWNVYRRYWRLSCFAFDITAAPSGKDDTFYKVFLRTFSYVRFDIEKRSRVVESKCKHYVQRHLSLKNTTSVTAQISLTQSRLKNEKKIYFWLHNIVSYANVSRQ